MTKKRTRVQDRFVDHDLGLAVVEAMVREGLVETDLRVPELEPEEDDDPDDESESWRDRIDETQMAVLAELRALLDAHADKLPHIEEIDPYLDTIHEEPEQCAEVDSLAGIELCSGLKRLMLDTRNKQLDLTPLTSLPALEELHLGDVRLRDLAPLLALPRLKVLTGRIDEVTAAKLRERGVDVDSGKQ
ncbi:hypothetical protein [Nannocystis punicea]|uniref:Uncharacterized protein n=1 Tax=Nannocystis punicea TaxID=2995304 RepID=A0ABY7GWI4_9BACT|nr:hypothetical protein [Nannocystis poenicansa]WAS91346.1 hypothetical protein O0S08_34595 [Nannocystis poenicansa]